MASRPALRALAGRAGILSAYREAGTNARRPTSDATREALLAAMGLSAESEAAAARTLHGLEAEERARLALPVQVARAGRRASWALRRPPGAREFALAVRCEDGRVLRREGRLRGGARVRIPLPALPPGVHELAVALPGARGPREARQTLVVAPPSCTPPGRALGRRRAFGLWANLYSLRSERGLGVGDLSDLRALVGFAADAGAEFVGLNPLHALRNRPPDVSPYAPVSRLFRNALYLDPEAAPELAECPEARRLLASDALRRDLAALRGARRIDYARTAAWHDRLAHALHRRFAQAHRGRRTARGRAYERFLRRHGGLVVDFGTFCALAERRPFDWRRWSPGLRRPDAAAVRAFREAHAEDVDFHVWVQFELERQLARAADTARRRGLQVGLYQDLAVGSAGSGFDTWAFPEVFASGASVGAPPDAYAALGQDWGFPPLDPRRLAGTGFRYFRLLLRSAFESAGALRIDHVMGLFRLFWIPRGRSAREGAYVRQPHEVLLALLALESRRREALVIGEDLGTVPPGLPARLHRAGILSSRVLLFERDREGRFRPARRYSRRALVTANTHDWPPLPAWVTGRDLEILQERGVLDQRDLKRARRRRARDVERLLERLAREGLLPRAEALPEIPDLCAAVHAFLCRTPSPLVGVSVDDLCGETEPVNVPGLPFERFPSWTRRMDTSLAEMRRAPRVRRALAGAASRRRRP